MLTSATPDLRNLLAMTFSAKSSTEVSGNVSNGWPDQNGVSAGFTFL